MKPFFEKPRFLVLVFKTKLDCRQTLRKASEVIEKLQIIWEEEMYWSVKLCRRPGAIFSGEIDELRDRYSFSS